MSVRSGLIFDASCEQNENSQEQSSTVAYGDPASPRSSPKVTQNNESLRPGRRRSAAKLSPTPNSSEKQCKILGKAPQVESADDGKKDVPAGSKSTSTKRPLPEGEDAQPPCSSMVTRRPVTALKVIGGVVEDTQSAVISRATRKKVSMATPRKVRLDRETGQFVPA